MSPDEVRAICQKLLDEFKNELADIRGDIAGLQDEITNLGARVTALEEQQGPKVTGWVNYRIGFASSLERERDHFKVGAEGWEDDPVLQSDLFDNVSDFDLMTAKLGASGKVTDDLMARVILKVRDTDAADIQTYDEKVGMDQHNAEQIWLDEALLDFNWKWASARAIVGRQFQDYGLGLLVNNARQSQQGIRLAWTDLFKTGLGLEGFVGGATYSFGNDGGHHHEGINDWPNFEGDGYVSMRLSYAQPCWRIGGNWLVDGMGNERGFGGDLWLKFWGGREIYGEYAQQTQSDTGYDYDNNPFAIMANVDIWKGNNWAVKGYYSIAEAKYSTWYSTVNPYFEQYNGSDDGKSWVQWGRWLDNAFILPNVRTIGGSLDFHVLNADWQALYYNLDNLGDNWEHTLWDRKDPFGLPYNQLAALRVKKQIANGVNLNLTYARQFVNEDAGFDDEYLTDIGYDDAQLLVAGIAVGF